MASGERVAIVSHNSARLIELLLAVPWSGRISVPINFRLSPDEVSSSSATAAPVCSHRPRAGVLAQGRGRPAPVRTGEEYEQLLHFDTEPRPWADPDEDATATINYTSGRPRAPRACR